MTLPDIDRANPYILPPLITGGVLDDLAELSERIWNDGATIEVRGSFGADLTALLTKEGKPDKAYIKTFAARCIYVSGLWANKVGSRPRVNIVGHCLGGSFEAVMLAAGTIFTSQTAVLGFPEPLVVDRLGQSCSWPFCGGYALRAAWGLTAPARYGRARNRDLIPPAPLWHEGQAWADAVSKATNLSVLARAQQMQVKRNALR